MKSCKVSVLIPTYNRATLLREVLQSLISQPLRDIEIVVMDDGSTDDTLAVVAALGDGRIRTYQRHRRGPTENLNEAISLSSGEYIMIAHDHDAYEPHMLTTFVAALDRHPSAGFAFCSYIFVNSDATREVFRWTHDWPELLEGRRFLQTVLLPKISSPVLGLSMIRREALAGGCFDAAVGPCADVELWHRLSSTHNVVYVREPLIRVRTRDATSLFHGGAATVDMIDKVLTAKKPYLRCVSSGWKRGLLRLRWRLQVDGGGLYVFWKAFESSDLAATQAMLAFCRREGTWPGYCLLKVLQWLPSGAGRSLLRGVRQVYRVALRKPTSATS